MLFKDLKPGDKFIFAESTPDALLGYSIASYVKLQFEVCVHPSFLFPTLNEIKNPAQTFWDLSLSQNAFTAIALHDGFLMAIGDETKIIKLY